MNPKWTESSIRDELSRLDKTTGLKGSLLPISFNNARCTLGLYSSVNGGYLSFQTVIFKTPIGLLKRL